MICVILREQRNKENAVQHDWVEHGYSTKVLKRLNVIAKIADLVFVDLASQIPSEDLDPNVGVFCSNEMETSVALEYLDYIGTEIKKLFGCNPTSGTKPPKKNPSSQQLGTKDQNSAGWPKGYCWLIEGSVEANYATLHDLGASEFVFDWQAIQKQSDFLKAFPLGGIHIPVESVSQQGSNSEDSLGKRREQEEIKSLGDGILTMELLDFFKDTGSPLYLSVSLQVALEETKNLASLLCIVRSTLEDYVPMSELYFQKKLRYGNTLVTPLRPQSVMLAAQVYRSFEADTEKYRLYGKAIQFAIEDFTENNHRKPVLALIGAGRGGILMQAVEFYAQISDFVVVEKNTACRWIVESRLRSWAESNLNKKEFLKKQTFLSFKNVSECCPSEGQESQWDIVVSEMLGCFGCDEQAPEVLSSIPAGLVSKSTVFIPASITAVVQPVQMYRSSAEKSFSSSDKHSTDLLRASNSELDQLPPQVFTPRWYRPLSPPKACFTHFFQLPDSIITTDLSTTLDFCFTTAPLPSIPLTIWGSMHSLLYDSCFNEATSHQQLSGIQNSNRRVELRTEGPGAAGWGHLVFGPHIDPAEFSTGLKVTVRRIWGTARYELQIDKH